MDHSVTIGAQTYQICYEVYGPTPPVECGTRIHQKLKVMRGTPFFHDLKLIRSLREMAVKEGVPLFMESFLGSSFIAWLVVASRVNPLPPSSLLFPLPQSRVLL